MIYLVLGLVLFLGVHSVEIFSPGFRSRAVEKMGEGAYKGIYTLLSIVGFILLVWGYGVARQDPILVYAPPVWTRHLAALLLLPVFPLLFAAYLPGRIKAAVKHPMLAAVKLWAFAHLLANGMLADLLLFGGFLIWAVADLISVKRRPVVRPVPGPPPMRYNDLIAVVGGLAVYVIFVLWLHVRLIGVAPIPPM
ncbi:NnrU family protein [Steroidobacter sp. S1-65]|uniref:NnrU family protein n=1 Tax=Steroidobacter gossypii TaxID=2805490 RepID=A0ABS1X288_9GAMM|nr:NnrU family protein [Steroidobacter gossypii]MBM0107341.1 NnrU family protein [Steroidobacter gossypii]